MSIGQTDQTKIWVLTRSNRPNYVYWVDRTDQNLGIGQTEQDQNMGVGLTKQTAVWILARPNRPKGGYWLDQTDRNMSIRQANLTDIWVLPRQTEQTKIWFLARANGGEYG